MSNELVVLPDQSVAVPMPVDMMSATGLESVSKLKPSNLILVQNGTRNSGKAKPGQILDTLTEEGYDSITVVPLFVSKGRVYFPPEEKDLDVEPTCRSTDGIVPSDYSNQKQARTCATCKHAKWIGRTRPPCDEKIRLLLLIKDTGIPRYFSVGGASLTSFKTVLDRIREDIAVTKNKEGVTLNLFDYYFTLRGQKVVKSFVYYVTMFEQVQKVATAGQYAPVFQEFVMSRRNQIAEEDAADDENKAPQQALNQIVEAEFVDA